VVVPHFAPPKTKKLGRAIENDGLRLSNEKPVGVLTSDLQTPKIASAGSSGSDGGIR